MSNTSQAIDFQKYIFDKDVDTRIKSSRDDMLKIMQADIKELHADIKALDAKVDRNNEVLNVKVDSNFEVLNAKIDSLAVGTQTGFKAIEDSIKKGKTLNKWIFGMLVTLLLGLGGLAVPLINSLIN